MQNRGKNVGSIKIIAIFVANVLIGLIPFSKRKILIKQHRIMKKSFFKCALIIMSLAAFQACNDTLVDVDILDPDIPLDVEVITGDNVEDGYEMIIDDVADDSEVGIVNEL